MKNAFKLLISVFAVSWIIKEILLPATAALFLTNSYMEYTIECDTAMEDSWYYRQNNTIPKESETIQLLACHEYDKIRKIMLFSGLPEEYLSWLGLKSLELYQKNPEKLVEQHRFLER